MGGGGEGGGSRVLEFWISGVLGGGGVVGPVQCQVWCQIWWKVQWWGGPKFYFSKLSNNFFGVGVGDGGRGVVGVCGCGGLDWTLLGSPQSPSLPPPTQKKFGDKNWQKNLDSHDQVGARAECLLWSRSRTVLLYKMCTKTNKNLLKMWNTEQLWKSSTTNFSESEGIRYLATWLMNVERIDGS